MRPRSWSSERLLPCGEPAEAPLPPRSGGSNHLAHLARATMLFPAALSPVQVWRRCSMSVCGVNWRITLNLPSTFSLKMRRGCGVGQKSLQTQAAWLGTGVLMMSSGATRTLQFLLRVHSQARRSLRGRGSFSEAWQEQAPWVAVHTCSPVPGVGGGPADRWSQRPASALLPPVLNAPRSPQLGAGKEPAWSHLSTHHILLPLF